MLGDEEQGIALQKAEDALAIMQAYGKAMGKPQ